MRKLPVILILSGIVLFGCNENETEAIPERNSMEESIDCVPGMIRVRLSKELGDNFSISKQNAQVRSGVTTIDTYLKEIGAVRMERVFPYAGKFEERTRKEGLHLWYDIQFDKSKPVTRVSQDIKNIPGVDYVEKIYNPQMPPYKLVRSEGPSTTRAGNMPFNDPELSLQWHYKNFGTFSKSIAGADINLFEAWKKETGKSNVIVSVVDGGIDVSHNDLKDNIYDNQAELKGQAGVDDDNNGYIDDIHGYNFVRNSGNVTPDDHGTHVAGTVAARNNNGIGVCGVAGGDGTPGSGIRLMSCQIFLGKESNGSANAIKYGADNGAVISQNSWGYTYPGPGYLPASEKAAIDYFIKYAGCDNQGKQLPDSPMKGGIVIFAAGNDDQDYLSYPSAYQPVVSVSAMAPDFKKAWYTNRGAWITLMAPGGDQFYSKGMVYSTTPGNTYGYMQGTSMACPHVSGIAALIVSKFGKQGFTSEELKKRLTTAFRPYDINKLNPNYKGRLGKGYIDADKTLAINLQKAPANVGSLTKTPSFISLDLSWKAVTDEDDQTASLYKLYYSLTELNTNNYKSASFEEIDGFGYTSGEIINYKLDGLKTNSTYYMAIVAIDRWGLSSSPVIFSAKTNENHPPKLTMEGNKSIRISGNETAELKILVNETDGQKWSYKVTGQKVGVTISQTNQAITLKFAASNAYGKYSLNVEVTDELMATASIKVDYEIYENHPPKLVKEFNKMFAPLNKNIVLNLADYFVDEDNQPLTYKLERAGSSNAKVAIEKGQLTITPVKVGSTQIVVSASDPHGKSIRATVDAIIVSNNLVYVAYPIPATTVLNVRLNDEVTNASITVLTTTGNQVLKRDVNVSDGNRLIALNVSNLAPATYVLNVRSNGNVFKQTFIKK